MSEGGINGWITTLLDPQRWPRRRSTKTLLIIAAGLLAYGLWGATTDKTANVYPVAAQATVLRGCQQTGTPPPGEDASGYCVCVLDRLEKTVIYSKSEVNDTAAYPSTFAEAFSYCRQAAPPGPGGSPAPPTSTP
jgi:hypothetical protein